MKLSFSEVRERERVDTMDITCSTFKPDRTLIHNPPALLSICTTRTEVLLFVGVAAETQTKTRNSLVAHCLLRICVSHTVVARFADTAVCCVH